MFARASGTDKLGLALLADQEIRGVALSLGKEETYYIPAAGFLSGAWLKAEAERAMNGAGEVCVFESERDPEAHKAGKKRAVF